MDIRSKKNNYLKYALRIGPTKYLFNIGEDLYNLFNLESDDAYSNFIFKSKKLLFTITDQFLELSTRSIVSTQTVIEKINSKEKRNKCFYKNNKQLNRNKRLPSRKQHSIKC